MDVELVMRKYRRLLSIFTILVLLTTFVSCSFDKKNSENSFSSNKSKKYSIKKLELPYNNYHSPQFYKNSIFVCVSKENENQLCDIINYDLKNKTIKNIYRSRHNSPALQSCMSNENWVVWQDTNETGEDFDICAMNMSNGEIKVIYRYSGYMTLDTPYLYEDYVAWVHTDNGKSSEILVYNLKTEKLENIYKVNTPGFYNAFLSIYDNKILWTDCIKEKGYYILYDLKSKIITKYEAPFKYPGYARMNNSKIYSINSNDIQGWGEFGVYNTIDGNYRSMPNKNIARFTLYNNIIALLTKENILEIYLDSGSSIEKILIDSDDINQTFHTIDFSNNGTLIVGNENKYDIVNKEEHKTTLYIIDMSSLINTK